MNKSICIGILAHVDAGKTTVTENLLYHGGVIKTLGSVDDGNTQTDTMELERKRGITIKASAISYNYKDIKINILDTPGHMDFISEVERSLSILDGAILIVSSVEEVQSQTKLIFDSLEKLHIPTIIFINKLDRIGSDVDRTYEQICRQLTQKAVKMQLCVNQSTKDIQIVDDIDDKRIKECIIDKLSEIDDDILEQYLTTGDIEKSILIDKIQQYTKNSELYPVFMGAAGLDIGTNTLAEKITTYLPVNEVMDDELSGVVFKINRNAAGDKMAYIRLFGGSIDVRQKITINDSYVEKVKNLACLEQGHVDFTKPVTNTDIGIIYGIQSLKIGDIIGKKSDRLKHINHLAKPTLKVKVALKGENDNHKLYTALQKLADEDPLLELETDNITKDIYVNLFGEVQKEVLSDLLKNDYKLDIEYLNTQTIYKERLCGTGSAIVHMWQNPNIYAATVELRVEPLNVEDGVVYESNDTIGYITKSFQNAVEEAVFETSKHGLYGWELTGIKVTFTYAEFDSVTSTPADFRNVTPMVLMEAIDKAKTQLMEPINSFELHLPEFAISKALFDLKMHRAVFDPPECDGDNYIVKGAIPVDNTNDFQIKITSYTQGKGILITRFLGYVDTKFDESKVCKCNYISPLNKKEYIMYKTMT